MAGPGRFVVGLRDARHPPLGDRFTLVGLKPRNRKYPVIGKDAAGRRFKFPRTVLDALE